MSVTDILADTSDSGNDGGTQFSNTIYSTVGATINTYTHTAAHVGQYYDTAVYLIWEALFEFDTSVIPANDTIVKVELILEGSNAHGIDVSFNVEARAFDFGTDITSADWVASGSLGALTLLATFASLGFSTSIANPFTSEAAFIAAINRSGMTRILLNSSRHRANTAPTTTTERLEFVGAGGGADRPLLRITHYDLRLANASATASAHAVILGQSLSLAHAAATASAAVFAAVTIGAAMAHATASAVGSAIEAVVERFAQYRKRRFSPGESQLPYDPPFEHWDADDTWDNDDDTWDVTPRPLAHLPPGEAILPRRLPPGS